MLGLPKATELESKKTISNKAICEKFQLNKATKEKLAANISEILITNEISSDRVNIAKGEQVKSFFVVKVKLKKKDFDQQIIILLSKLIPQNMLFVLEYIKETKLAVFHTRLLQTEWKKECAPIELVGLTLDSVWENIIMQVGGITLEDGNTLDQQIDIDEMRQKLKNEINRLDKLARKEKQPKKKLELKQQINKLEKELEEQINGQT